jgi:uncharacterized SAM-binding protein YcdF (DUF218 family)
MLVVTFIVAVLFALGLWMLRRTIKSDPRTLDLGTWTLFTLFFLAGLITMVLVQFGTIGITVFALLTVGVLSVFVLFLSLFDLIVIYFSVQIWRKEYHTLGNLLLPLLFIAFVVFNALQRYSENFPDWAQPMFVASSLLEIYFIMAFINFLVGAIVYSFLTRKSDHDFYVVLGAGLIDGHKVSRLLGNRIKAAVDAAEIHKQKFNEYPTIIFSGGKGGDEALPEAVAMRDYAVNELHYPIDRTITEENSETTRENMKFSRDKIEAITKGKDDTFTFFTSEYHVFRAAVQARAFGVAAEGRPGKSAWYFRISAFIREYIAVLNMNRRRHIAVVVSVLLIALVATGVSLF